jgi:hypothetical protein
MEGTMILRIVMLAAVILAGASAPAATAGAAPLLPSQEEPKVFSVKMCENAGVLANVKSALEEYLKTEVTLGRDVRLQSVTF